MSASPPGFTGLFRSWYPRGAISRRGLAKSANIHGKVLDVGSGRLCVPFMKEVHPDPHDYWRYTGESLAKLAEEAGFEEVTVLSFGGLFLVIAELLMPCLRYRLLKSLAVMVLVGLNEVVNRAITEKRNRETYVLGYLLSAKKRPRP